MGRWDLQGTLQWDSLKPAGWSRAVGTSRSGGLSVPKAVDHLGFSSDLRRGSFPGVEVLHPGLRFFVVFVFVFFPSLFFFPTLQ